MPICSGSTAAPVPASSASSRVLSSGLQAPQADDEERGGDYVLSAEVLRRGACVGLPDTTVAATQHGAVGFRAPRHVTAIPGPTALVTAPVMADPAREEARAALALLETCPVPLASRGCALVDIVTESDGLLQGAEDCSSARARTTLP